MRQSLRGFKHCRFISLTYFVLSFNIHESFFSLQVMQTRAHVAVLNAAGKATAAQHGLHVVDFELMTSRFEKPANYLAVRCFCPSVKINQKMHSTNFNQGTDIRYSLSAIRYSYSLLFAHSFLGYSIRIVFALTC